MARNMLLERIQAFPSTLADIADRPAITSQLDAADAAKNELLSLRPFDGVEQSALDDYRHSWMARYTYNSNAIEGSTLTLEDTELVLEGEFVPEDSPARYVFAAKGVADGMAYVEQYVTQKRRIDVAAIRHIHEVTALDVQPVLRGAFRPYGYLARITGTAIKTADPLDINEDMEALCDMTTADVHPVLLAAGFHILFEHIHPFADGNGRTGRQLLNYMLMEAGYPPVAIKHDSGRRYAHSLQAWQADDDPQPFVGIICDCLLQEATARSTIVRNLRSPLR